MDAYGNSQYGPENVQAHQQSGNAGGTDNPAQYNSFIAQNPYAGQYPIQNTSQNEDPGQTYNFDGSSQQCSQSMDMGQNDNMQFQAGNDSPSRTAGSPFEVVPSSTMTEDPLIPGSLFSHNQAQQMGSGQNLGMVSQYMNNQDPYGMGSPESTFASPMVSNSQMDIGMDSQYMSNNIDMNMAYSASGLQGMMNGTSMDYNNMMSAGQYQAPQMGPMAPTQNTPRRSSAVDLNGLASAQRQQSPQRRPTYPGAGQQQFGANQGRASNAMPDSSRRHSMPANGNASRPYQSQASSEAQDPRKLESLSQMQVLSNQSFQNQGMQVSDNTDYSWQPMHMRQQPAQQQQQQQQQQPQQQQQQLQQALQRRAQQPTQQQVQQQFQQQQGPFGQRQQLKSSQQPELEGPLPRPAMATPSNVTAFTNAYSSTGFDMVSVLASIANRKNPQIDFGPVDLSCAFVVCDAHQHDFPICYCSENFERLTGYTKHEILGRNCRFLQSPDGRVNVGVKRTCVDDASVYYLKTMITERREAQVALINYRKGGQPFTNLLTTIPVAGDDGATRYFVGFQVDLVEQPGSLTNNNSDGTYTVNYQRGLQMPRYVFDPSRKPVPPQLEAGQTVSRDDVSTVLNAFQDASAQSEFSQRIWDKVLLENADDVVFVLSLKGLFLYLSPSCKRILEYPSTDLIGTSLSSVCHPSDIVPVTRELKETTSAASVDIVFRFRRKERGYMWFEGHGSLHTEQGKGRKSIVLVGRERPVYAVSKSEIRASGGIGDNEIWSKLSTSGVFLFVASNVKQLLDRTQEELMGTSIQALMRAESRPDFSRIMDIAKTGKCASVKHEIMNKRGQVVQAFSTLYSGDAAEGEKPTFIIAQTRLTKYTRPSGSSSRPQTSASRPSSGNLNTTTTGSNTSSSAGNLSRTGSFTFPASPSAQIAPSTSNGPPQHFMTQFESATTTSGEHGLALGRQDVLIASSENLFEELKTTRSTSWQYELRQMEKHNRLLAEELQALLAARKKRKRRKQGAMQKDCANCHTHVTPEWRRGPSGQRDLCNSCGLRYAKKQGRISPRTNKSSGSKASGGGGHGQTSPTDATSKDKVQPATGETSPAPGMKRRYSGTGVDAAAGRRSSAGGVLPPETRPEGEDSGASSNKVMKVEADDARGEGRASAEPGHDGLDGPDDAGDASGQDGEPPADDRDADGDSAMGEHASASGSGAGMNPKRHSGYPNLGTDLDDVLEVDAVAEKDAETDAERAAAAAMATATATANGTSDQQRDASPLVPLE